MKSDDTVTDPGELFELADAAAEALTVDFGTGSSREQPTPKAFRPRC
ncbi:hypothetical protein ACWD04_12915 [Streptomyces sp. NPDC002911]